jgi:hypothetical protein
VSARRITAGLTTVSDRCVSSAAKRLQRVRAGILKLRDVSAKAAQPPGRCRLGPNPNAPADRVAPSDQRELPENDANARSARALASTHFDVRELSLHRGERHVEVDATSANRRPSDVVKHEPETAFLVELIEDRRKAGTAIRASDRSGARY